MNLTEHKLLAIIIFCLLSALAIFAGFHYASMDDDERPRWIW